MTQTLLQPFKEFLRGILAISYEIDRQYFKLPKDRIFDHERMEEDCIFITNATRRCFQHEHLEKVQQMVFNFRNKYGESTTALLVYDSLMEQVFNQKKFIDRITQK